MIEHLTQLTGKKQEKPLDLYYLYHTFKAESSMNLTLPEWAYKYYPNGLLFDAIVAAYDIANSTPLLRRLYSGKFSILQYIVDLRSLQCSQYSLRVPGPIIRAMLSNMRAAQNTSSDTKIYLYSGHETNIATLLHAFNVYKPHVPEFSSAVVLELLEQDKQYYTRVSASNFHTWTFFITFINIEISLSLSFFFFASFLINL